MIKTITDKIDGNDSFLAFTIFASMVISVATNYDVKTKVNGIEQKLNSVQQVVIEKEVPKPTLPEVQIGNIVGGPLPDKYFVIGQDENGNEQRVYLSIDGKLVDDYFK